MEILDCINALKALGEESRMRIVSMLIHRQHSVNEIADTLGISQYNVSKHLRILREAGLVETTKHGQQRLYTLPANLHTHLAENNNTLDLGCCTFRFDDPEAPAAVASVKKEETEAVTATVTEASVSASQVI